ncbi:hypothetical protein Q5P01_018872 [Channa striata]|uniref:Saxitoxin and tetrodotoxin-binding protein 1 n=1 Tax=Channa striata TaxID=64152 RepID=A0AA88M596_CHASR|nr:hypothetical protein Q5P01_018872 [Channa striata]
MYCVLKLLVLLLVLVLVGSSTAPAAEGCEVLTTRLQAKDLHKIYGDWVMVWSVSGTEHGSNLLANLTSSRVNFHLLVPNSKIIVYSEKNVFNDSSCTVYLINLRIPAEHSESGHHTLLAKSGTVMKYGVFQHYTDSGTVTFYEPRPNCLLMVYKGPYGQYLLSYKREGQHSDADQLKAAHDVHRKHAQCLGFAHDKPYIYDGAAAPVCKHCEGVNTRLRTKDLHKIFGDWVLVWSVADHTEAWDLLPNVSSSHIELKLLPNNKTVVFNERNVYSDKTCSNYVINLAMPSDPSDAEHHTLHTVSATEELDGVVRPYNDSAALEFYETCPDCLLMVYNYIHGRYLLSYRREGRHSDVEQLKAAHDDHRKQAECLGFAHDNVFIYDGVSAVGLKAVPNCRKCQDLNTRLPTKDLHKIFGDWVLVWSVADHQQAWDLLPNVSSSHVELQLLPDKKTVVFNERNLYIDKTCSNYVINLAMPSDPSDAEHHTLHTVSATEELDGVVRPYNDSAALEFYETCPDCLLMVYNYIHGRYLLSYRREGRHSDVEQLKAAHDDHRKQAECLGFKADEPFSYDGVADFCHKKPSPVEREQ